MPTWTIPMPPYGPCLYLHHVWNADCVWVFFFFVTWLTEHIIKNNMYIFLNVRYFLSNFYPYHENLPRYLHNMLGSFQPLWIRVVGLHASTKIIICKSVGDTSLSETNMADEGNKCKKGGVGGVRPPKWFLWISS